MELEGRSEEIERDWSAAQFFLAKGPSATLQFLVEDAKAALYALRAQAIDGPCPPGLIESSAGDPALRKKQEAWSALGSLPSGEAKKKLVEFLNTVLPEWKVWRKQHGDLLQVAYHEGEPERLLKAFRARTGVDVASRL